MRVRDRFGDGERKTEVLNLPALTGRQCRPKFPISPPSRAEKIVKPTGLASLEVNVIVVEILEAARQIRQNRQIDKTLEASPYTNLGNAGFRSRFAGSFSRER